MPAARSPAISEVCQTPLIRTGSRWVPLVASVLIEAVAGTGVCAGGPWQRGVQKRSKAFKIALGNGRLPCLLVHVVRRFSLTRGRRVCLWTVLSVLENAVWLHPV